MRESGLSKVSIIAFKDKAYRKKIKEKIELSINPAQLSRSLKVDYGTEQPAGAEGNSPKYKATESESITFEFTLDGTGVIPVQGKAGQFHTDVAKQLKAFLKVVYRMNGETHKPNFLRLVWGDFSFGASNHFDCILTELKIDYTLISPTGKPLRAKLTGTFLSYLEEKKRIRQENKHSPDVTHVRTVAEGDRLPLMTEGIYGDQSYYLQVAKANGLVNFRRLKTSQSLRFPPIDKTAF